MRSRLLNSVYVDGVRCDKKLIVLNETVMSFAKDTLIFRHAVIDRVLSIFFRTLELRLERDINTMLGIQCAKIISSSVP